MPFKSAEKRKLLLLGAVVTLAAGLRLFDLGAKSFWLDEILETQYYADGFSRVLWKSQWDVHPPLRLFYNGLPFWLRYGFGADGLPLEWELRLVPALLGVATVAAFFLYLARWAPLGVATVGALLLACNPEHLEHSQDARMYSAYLFLSVLLVWAADTLAFPSVPDQTPRWFGLGFILLAVISLANTYLAFFPVLGTGLGLAWVWRERSGYRQLALAMVPILLVAVTVYHSRALWANKSLSWGGPEFALGQTFLLRIESEWFVCPALPATWITASNLLATCLALLGLVSMVATRNPRLPFMVANLALPLSFLLLARTANFFASRYLLYLLPLLILLIAQGLWCLGQRVAGRPIAVGLLAVFLGLQAASLRAYFQLEKQDWRRASHGLVASLTPGRTTILLAGPTRVDQCLIYYLRRAQFQLLADPIPGSDSPYWYHYLLFRRGDLELRVYPPTVDPALLQEQVKTAGSALYLGSFPGGQTPSPYPAVAWALGHSQKERSWPGQFPWAEVELRRITP